MTETMVNEYRSHSTQRELSNEYQHDRTNPSNAEASSVQGTRMHRFLKTRVLTKSYLMNTNMTGFKAFITQTIDKIEINLTV